jgi:CheY-like chemotaxis protein
MAITDDGRGIAFRPLLEKAPASNLIDRREAERLTPDQVRELIFLPGLTTADKLNLNAGRGVGMSIVRENIAALGGSVTIETWPQRGTTFTIRVPRPFADTTPLRYDDGDQISGGSPGIIKVLIVDDSPSVRLQTSRIVENAGWFFETAKNGYDALEKLRTMVVRPDVILTDIEMPKMGGYEFLAAVRDDELLREIPVVFISSRSDPAERERAISAGVSHYLTKPYERERLIVLVEELAHRHDVINAS